MQLKQVFFSTNNAQNIQVTFNFAFGWTWSTQSMLKLPVAKVLLGKFWKNIGYFQLQILSLHLKCLLSFFREMKVERF